jgi:hypothetical protein
MFKKKETGGGIMVADRNQLVQMINPRLTWNSWRPGCGRPSLTLVGEGNSTKKNIKEDGRFDNSSSKGNASIGLARSRGDCRGCAHGEAHGDDTRSHESAGILGSVEETRAEHHARVISRRRSASSERAFDAGTLRFGDLLVKDAKVGEAIVVERDGVGPSAEVARSLESAGALEDVTDGTGEARRDKDCG